MHTVLRFNIILLLIFLFQNVSFAQNNKRVVTYYDPQRKHLQEDYFVLPDGNNTMNGAYKRYSKTATLK